MRRILVLAALLAASPGRGALPRVFPVGGQLSLPLAAPVAAAPAALAPATLTAPVPVLAVKPTPVIAAFHSGDPVSFLKAARAAQYEPPEGDEHQTALYQLALEREAAERAVRGLERTQATPARTARSTAIDYDEFGRQLSRHPGLNLDAFRHADAKRRILKASGYSRLHGAGGTRIAIERADDVRVGKAFINVLRAFERRGN